MQLAIANFWIVSLPIPLFPMDGAPEILAQEVTATPSTQIPSTQAQQQPLETVEPIEKIGTQGNWVKKRDWLIKAHEVANEIQEISAQMEQTRKLFINAYNEIDSILDDYYKQLGLDDGKIQGLFDNIKRYLEKKQKKELALLEAPDNQKPDLALQTKIDLIQESIKPLKQQLSQLKLDMKSIDDLDKSLTDRIKRVDDQMGIIQEMATNSKNITQDMWDIIDHNKARDKYYELKLTILEKTKNIQSYLKDDLFRDFQSVIGTIKAQMTRTQDQIKKLEDEGLFIKDRAQKVKEFKQLSKEAQQKIDAERASAQKQQQVKIVEKPTGLLSKIYNFFASVLHLPVDFTLWIKAKIMGQTPSLPPASPMPQGSDLKAPTNPSTAGATVTIPLIPQLPPAIPLPASAPLPQPNAK